MAKAKPRKGGSGKNKKSGKKRGAPKKRPPKAKKQLSSGSGGGAGTPGGLGGGRPRGLGGSPVGEVDPGYYILKQVWVVDQIEYEVGQVLVEGTTENWWMYTLNGPDQEGRNGYTYPADTDSVQRWQSTNIQTRFVYSGTSTVEAICKAVGNMSTYMILTSQTGDCKQ